MRDVLLGFAVITGYCLFVLAWPIGPCLRCRGKRVTRSKRILGKGRKIRKCRWCKGRGLRRWPLATAVHRFWWSVLGDRLMERRRDAQRDDRTRR